MIPVSRMWKWLNKPKYISGKQISINYVDVFFYKHNVYKVYESQISETLSISSTYFWTVKINLFTKLLSSGVILAKISWF